VALVATVVAAVYLAIGGGAFFGARNYRVDHDRITPSPTLSSTPAPTPRAVLGATATPSVAPTSTAPAPASARVAAQVASALSAATLGPSVRASIVDATTGTVLLDRGATIASAPASTAKLTTAAAVLATISPTSRLTTRVVAGSTPGQVVLIGGGDPTLSAAAAGAMTAYAGAARVSDLARQVKAALGATPVRQIVVDTSLFSGPAEGPGWDPEDVPSDYASAISSLVVDGGLPASGGGIRSATPDLEAGRALADLLGVPNVDVARGRAVAGAKQLASVRSAPVLDLVEQMLSESDNVLAEMLGRQVAIKLRQPATFAGAVAAIRQALATQGFMLPAGLVDASGLSGDNRISPSTLVGLLRAALSPAHPALNQLFAALPIAGWEGTLANRYQVPASATAAGQIRAKTGTLSGVSTLAGIVRDADGRLLVFAFMTDQVPVGGTDAAEAALDVAAARLAACGCG
jgi:D-alanyl-D-alanine carboxypeptidase/D-alanyl-D-alanine-endopeptidase (penicillin-binding protein 4)